MSTNSSSSNLSNGLELATRGIDLVTTLIHASETRSNGTLGVMVEVAKWLGRERLNQNELEDCLKRGRSLAEPNISADSFFHDLVEETSNRSFLTLHTRTTGSLGRMLAIDPRLCWMVSTVACLFQYESEYEVNHCLRTILRNSEDIPKDHKTGKISYRSFVGQDASVAHLSRVVKAIVSSIWFNVVNAGHATIPLPQEILEVCRHGHLLKSFQMAFLLTVLRKPRRRLIIMSRHLYRDLTHWILLHYHGQFQVTVSGKIVYKKILGNSDRHIELRVEEFCDDTGKCQDCPGKYQIVEEIAGTFEQLFEKETMPEADHMEVPRVRRALYELPQLYRGDHRSALPSIQKQIRAVARNIMAWLLQLKVYPPTAFTNLGFTVRASNVTEEHCIGTISNIMMRSPGLLNMQWGTSGTTKMVFEDQVSIKDPVEDTPDPILTPDRRFEELLPWFPILDDLVAKVKEPCLCQRCESPEIFDGCLAYTAIMECLALLAHGIADSFGVDDVSGSVNNVVIAKGMLQILLDIAEEKGMLWSVWFSVASCVLLGCPNPTIPIRADPTLSGSDGSQSTTTVVAMQYGSLVAMAPWLDLTQEHRVLRCFGLVTLRGKLGVDRRSSGGRRLFSGISDEFAVVGTHMTDSTTNFVERWRTDPKEKESPQSQDNNWDHIDMTECIADCMLVRLDDNYFSLLTRVMSDAHSRVVDPVDALIRRTHGIRHAVCEPGCTKSIDVPKELEKIYVHENFSDILGKWSKWSHMFRFISPETPLSSENGSINDENTCIPRIGQVYVTSILGDTLKWNVAMALSMNGTVILNDGSCCFSCLSKLVARDVATHVYVLNRAPTSRHALAIRGK